MQRDDCTIFIGNFDTDAGRNPGTAVQCQQVLVYAIRRPVKLHVRPGNCIRTTTQVEREARRGGLHPGRAVQCGLPYIAQIDVQVLRTAVHGTCLVGNTAGKMDGAIIGDRIPSHQ